MPSSARKAKKPQTPSSGNRRENLTQAFMKSPVFKSGAGAQFAAIYTDNINPDDLAQFPPAFFQRAIAHLWEAAEKRKGKSAAIEFLLPGAKNPELGKYSLISIVGDDMPFLVDSTTQQLHRQNLAIEAVIHPTAYIEKNQGGKIVAVHPPRHLQKIAQNDAAKRLSLIQFVIATPSVDLDTKSIKDGLQRVLSDVRSAVEDWPAMRKKLAEVISELPAGTHSPTEREEARRFLEWLDQDHFTFLGYRADTYPKPGSKDRIQVIPNSGLGVITDPNVRVLGNLCDHDGSSPELKRFFTDQSLISISKSDQRATVHRFVPMDVISIKRYDASGRVVGEHRFVGLFTSLSYSRNPRDVPMLRQKVDNIIKRSGWNPTGHKAKILIDVLVSFPRDELIQIGEDELFDIALGIARAQEKMRTALFMRRDQLGRYYSCLIYTPRDIFSSDLRQKFGRILEQHLHGAIRNYYTQLSDQLLARVHFIIDINRDDPAPVDQAALERELIEASRSFQDRLREAVIKKFGEAEAVVLLRRYHDAFSIAHQNIFTMKDTLIDIEKIESIYNGTSDAPDLAIHLYNQGDAAKGECWLALYQKDRQLALSDILPTLENMGFRVLSEIPTLITPRVNDHPAHIWLHDIQLLRADGQAVDVDALRNIFINAFAGIRTGAIEDDGFNRLIVSNAMPARDIVIFRTYAKYLRQIGFTISQAMIERTLSHHAGITGDLQRLFYTLFDPALKDKNRTASARAIETDILQKLEKVSIADEDRILRKYLNLMNASLRTNFFQKDKSGKPKSYISVKLSSALIEDLPEPKPWCEIFVCSPRVEAIHLRSGRVARGGIRWSDRREDFRTEILGLVKAQIVKNTVIVPVGSKGGFVLKQAPADRAGFLAEGVECYKIMLRGLLDITDNLKNNKVVPPQDVVRRDGDDPYLVVAADKGTAKFSDTANGISADYDFWLGDAFASGGSAGYDHKGMGITARGGWVAVERHFREAGIDSRKTEFTAIGVGDMAGDVFGNAMLLSDKMKLLAAFNHNHIFIDPNPDPAKSFLERKRLFENPQLSWADYDKAALSKGGAVYDRSAKKIAPSAEAQKSLGLHAGDYTPAQLIQSILKAPADLLWLGGIGTFVKAAQENNADVGDRANDALRVSGYELRCKIVGEGANLGFTQEGRIEFAMTGGRINTDAIDNSAGVDTSDHEVNIKILLTGVERSGKLDRAQRNKLLKQMTGDVAGLVLNDNYEQTLAISVMQPETVESIEDYARQIKALEKTARLSRRIEFLPTEEEIAERALLKRGLTRPELAVVLAYSKMAVYEALLASDLPDDPLLESYLFSYFPEALQKRYPVEIKSHPLRREIIATVITNSMVNRMGANFAHSVAETTGYAIADVARAYIAAREAFGTESIWHSITALDYKTDAALQIKMIRAINRFIERAAIWFLRQRKGNQGLTALLAAYAKPIAEVEDNIEQLLSGEELKILQRKAKEYAQQNVPIGIARQVVFSRMLGSVGDAINIANSVKKPVMPTVSLYYDIGSRFGLDWMRRTLSKLAKSSAWQSRAVASLIDDLLGLQARLTKEVAKTEGVGEKALESWLNDHRPEMGATDALLAEIHAATTVDVAMITVAISQIRTLLV